MPSGAPQIDQNAVKNQPILAQFQFHDRIMLGEVMRQYERERTVVIRPCPPASLWVSLHSYHCYIFDRILRLEPILIVEKIGGSHLKA